MKGTLVTGMYIGRFQPFHLGHLWAINHALKTADRLILVVGSAEKPVSRQNPLTSQERIEIIGSTLGEEGLLDRCKLVELDDVDDDFLWVEHVESIASFDILYAGEGLSKRLFSEAGRKVGQLPRWKDISATSIRKMMVDGEEWKALVHPVVAKFLEKIGIAERLRSLSE